MALILLLPNPKNLIFSHLKECGGSIDRHSSNYENFILLGGFNS